jgi:hypothetical protein
MIQLMHHALESVRDRVDHDFVESDDFESLVEEVMEKANQRKEIDKRAYYAALLASAAQPAGRIQTRSIE